jgi:hypothetical protein
MDPVYRFITALDMGIGLGDCVEVTDILWLFVNAMGQKYLGQEIVLDWQSVGVLWL